MRRHTAYDEKGEETFWVRSLAPYTERQKNYGYELCTAFTTIKLGEGNSVAKLKALVESISTPPVSTESVR